MAAFVLRFGARGGRRYLAQAAGDASSAGHRPFTWVREACRALTFPTATEARAFGLAQLGHGFFDVGRCERRA